MPELTWDKTYLLGWYGSDGRPYLSTWSGDLPRVDVVVTGSSPYGPPLWKASVKTEQLHPLPKEHVSLESKIAYATSLGGVYAFGWYVEEGVQR